MTSFEWLAAAYFAAFIVFGAMSATRLRAGSSAAAAALLVVIVARFAPWELRAWAPHLYLVLGYWIPALCRRPAPSDRFERWLQRVDERIKSQIPNPKSHGPTLELAYLLCYPLVPVAFAVVYAAGDADDIARFWLAVLLAGYACYGTLIWTDARPPRLVAGEAATRSLIGQLNLFVLGRVSHQRNTFPSGHVAVSLAAALAVWSVSPAAAAGVLLVSLAIALAAVAGRYHYLIDVLLGLLVGIAAWGLGSWALGVGS